MKKYLTRAIKYFIFLMVIVALVVVLMVLFKFVGTDINEIFRGGYNSVWQIALIFLAVALIYPKIGFGSRKFTIRAEDWDEARRNIFICMGEHSYKLESDEGNVLKFRKKLIITKLAKFLEDRITIEKIEEDPTENQPLSDIVKDLEAEKTGADEEKTVGTNQEEVQNTSLTEVQKESVVPNKYVVNIEGLTKDVLRIVSGLYGIQNRNKAE